MYGTYIRQSNYNKDKDNRKGTEIVDDAEFS